MKALIIILLFLFSFPALPAQEAGRFGIAAEISTVSYIGVIYNPIGNFSIIPRFSISTYSSEFADMDVFDSKTRLNQDQLSIGGGIAMQYYVGTWDELSAYVGASGGHIRTTLNSTAMYGRHIQSDTTIVEHKIQGQTNIGAYFGVQYMISRWLALYVNLTANCNISTVRYEEKPDYRSEGTLFSLSNSGGGLILYF